MPEDGVHLVSHHDVLRFEEILSVVQASVELGIENIRITGGEPLMRLGIADLVHMISTIEGIRDISMTTNGIQLAKYASVLRNAGLNRVNISLDTLNKDRFKEITRLGDLDDTICGIEAAISAGLNPVKINMVPMRGINDDEIIDFAGMTLKKGWHVRFIELMPLTGSYEFVPSAEIQKKIELLGPLEPYTKIRGNGAARNFRLPQASGTIGFISPLSEPFCQECNRLRLSSTGMLYTCLFAKQGLDIRTPIRNGANNEIIKSLLKEAIADKPRKHHFDVNKIEDQKMYSIGG